MDSDNISDSCIVVEKKTVFVDAAAVARRKRMEIMRFKQSSKKTHSHGFHKRSRPLNADICELCDAEDDDHFLSSKSDLEVPLFSRLFAGTDGKADFGHAIVTSGNPRLSSGGLVRSKSFPPEGWHSQCTYKFSKTSHDCTAGEVVEGLVATVVVNEPGNAKDSQVGLHTALSMEVSRNSDSSSILSSVHTASVAGEDSCCNQHHKQQEEKSVDVRKDDESSSFASGLSAEPSLEVSETEDVVSEILPSDREAKSSTVASQQGLVMTSSSTVSTASSESSSHSRRCFSDGKCPPCGKLLFCGRRREMEDTAAVVPAFTSLPCDAMGGCLCGTDSEKNSCSDLHYFAVYDGHGGSQASKFCSVRLHELLSDELSLANSNTDPADGWDSKWNNVFTACFMKMDREVGGVCPSGECNEGDGTSTCCVDAIAPENVGTTAIVAVVGACQIIIANCGDSRAVLSRGGKAVPLSTDHKPEREDENSRIEAAGGRVIYWDGHRVGGLLALSRALGDRYLKQYVIAQPDVTCLQRTEEDECLILASDGLWDVISNEYACEVARKSLASAWRKCENGTSPLGDDSAAAQVAALLVKVAYGRGSKDNISVVVVDLKGSDR